MHGRNWAPIAQGSRVPGWRDDFLYQYFEFPAAHCVRPHRGVRDRRWKLIQWDYPAARELYDLANDPGEQVNLAGQPRYAAEEQRLRARLAELRREVGDVDPPGYVTGDPADLKYCPPVSG
jgi:arylsulfatase A-like enzyme